MPSNKDIALFYSTKLKKILSLTIQNWKKIIQNQANRYRCVCSVEPTKSPSRGWGNLTTHVLTSHPDYATKKRSNQSVFPHTVTPKARTIFGWLEGVILNGVSFSFVENELNIKYSRLEKLSEKNFHEIFGTCDRELKNEVQTTFHQSLL